MLSNEDVPNVPDEMYPKHREEAPMAETPIATQTPNVVIENPKIRRTVRSVIDAIGGAIFIVGAVDAASAGFDLAWLLVPAGAGYIAVRTVFGFAVDSPNTPK